MLKGMKKAIKKLALWSNKREWLIILVLLVIGLRLPTLTTPHYYGDEEIYFVMGRAWSEQVPLYQEMFDHKPPLIYVLAGLFPTVYEFRLALLVSMVIHTILFFCLAKKIFAGSKPKLAYVSSVLFVLLTSLPTLEGNIANAELFMMLPVTASLLLIYQAKETQWERYLAAGLVAGIGWLYKVPVIMDVAAIALYFFVFRKETFWAGVKGVLAKSFWAYVLGFALPLALTFGYYYLKGHGPAYLATVLSVNLSYVSSWETSTWAFNPLRSGLMSRGIILLGFTLLLYLLRKKMSKETVLVLLWTGFAFFGALLSGRPYPHYLLQPVVPMALVLPMMTLMETAAAWAVLGYLMIWGVVTAKTIGFWWYPTWPLYTNFWQYATGKMSKQAYLETFDGARRNYEIARYLNERMAPEDKLYVWGSDAAIYNITKKIPAGGKYIVNFHVHDLQKHDYVMANLEKNQPKFIVVLPNTTEFPQLAALLEDKYLQVLQVEGAVVYRLASPTQLGQQAKIEVK